MGRNGGEVIEFTALVHEAGVESNFFSSFATGGIPERFAGVLPAAWDAHFAAVGPHLLCAAGEDNDGFWVAVEGYQHR